MKKFRFVADVAFRAEDLDDAFKLLSQHFLAERWNRQSPLKMKGEFMLYSEKSKGHLRLVE